MTTARKRVLLVDDDEQVLESLGCVLEERGFEVLIARDGVEGLARAERDAPDLIMLDMVMPRRSGIQVLERLRQRRIHVPRVIMMTANAEQRHRDFAESRGVDAFVQKPFDPGQLVLKVELLLET